MWVTNMSEKEDFKNVDLNSGLCYLFFLFVIGDFNDVYIYTQYILFFFKFSDFGYVYIEQKLNVDKIRKNIYPTN